MKVTRIYTGTDGESHSAGVVIEMSDVGLGGSPSKPVPASSVIFREVDGDCRLDFHTAPRRQYVVNLTGAV